MVKDSRIQTTVTAVDLAAGTVVEALSASPGGQHSLSPPPDGPQAPQAPKSQTGAPQEGAKREISN